MCYNEKRFLLLMNSTLNLESFHRSVASVKRQDSQKHLTGLTLLTWHEDSGTWHSNLMFGQKNIIMLFFGFVFVVSC